MLPGSTAVDATDPLELAMCDIETTHNSLNTIQIADTYKSKRTLAGSSALRVGIRTPESCSKISEI